MKNNGQVTQREVDYADTDVFVTRTDLKGVITYANDAFCKIAGFAEEELIGKSHNIVRHQDMPSWAFADLWKTVKSGRPWRGIVKNRCKNGDHYWVCATVSPVLRHGQVVGFLSLRKKPSREEVAHAEALYRSNPNAAPSPGFSIKRWFNNIKLQYKMMLLIQPLLFVLLSSGTYALYQQVKFVIVSDATQKGEASAMQVIDSANMLMVTGAISDENSRRLMIKKIIEGQKLSSLRLMRTEQVVRQFGPGLPEEHLDDPLVKEVIDKSVKAGKSIPYVNIQNIGGKPMLRIITPYIESRDFHGTDCLACHQVKEGSSNGASDMTIDMSANMARLNRIMIGLVVGQIGLQLILFILIWLALGRSVVRPVMDVIEHLHEIVDGDFTRRVNGIHQRDEIGALLCAAQSTKVLTGAVIDQIVSSAREIEMNASHLADAVEQAGAASHAQSESSHAMASNIEEISVSIDHVADNAAAVRKTADASASTAVAGGGTVRKVIEEMSSVGRDVLSASESVQALGKRSSEITGIVATIKEIADQTNLLALNAAIEAARAGEQGRGFAVVADEVRKLAEQTARSTVTIGEVVNGISDGTQASIRLIDAAVEKVHRGEKLAEDAGSAIADIAKDADAVRSGVSDITASVHEQSVATREIAAQVEKIAQMSEENSASILRVDDSAKTLERLSEKLKKLTESFRI